MDLGLTGKITLITGSSGGIGKEVARAFLREGARVILNGTNAEKLEKTRTALEEIKATETAGIGEIFTEKEARTVIQMAELTLENGLLCCDRDRNFIPVL